MWCGLKGEKQFAFKDRIGREKVDEDIDKTWNEVASCIKRVLHKYLENLKDMGY